MQLAPQVWYPRFCRAVGNQNPERPSSTRATDVSSLGWVGRPSAWEAASSPRPFDPPRESAEIQCSEGSSPARIDATEGSVHGAGATAAPNVNPHRDNAPVAGVRLRESHGVNASDRAVSQITSRRSTGAIRNTVPMPS